MRHRISILSWSMAAVIGLTLPGLGCGRTNQADSGMPAEKKAELQALQQKREDRHKQLQGMNVKQLAEALAVDSQKGREPFNSSAYKETIGRGESAAGELKEALTRDDPSSLLALLALRHVSATQYQSLAPAFRVNTLVSSLSGSKYFNTWGIPNLYWEDAARAILAEGRVAEPSLTKLLGDRRPAPVYGSEGAIVDAQFHYRVCDYALALLTEIQHQKSELPKEPAERDRQIEELVKAAAKRK